MKKHIPLKVIPFWLFEKEERGLYKSDDIKEAFHQLLLVMSRILHYKEVLSGEESKYVKYSYNEIILLDKFLTREVRKRRRKNSLPMLIRGEPLSETLWEIRREAKFEKWKKKKDSKYDIFVIKDVLKEVQGLRLKRNVKKEIYKLSEDPFSTPKVSEFYLKPKLLDKSRKSEMYEVHGSVLIDYIVENDQTVVVLRCKMYRM